MEQVEHVKERLHQAWVGVRIRHAIGIAVVLALGAAISLITSSVVASRAYTARAEQAAKSRQELTVKGSARMPVTSDLGTWSIRVSGEGADLAGAYAVLEAATTRVREFLLQQGFETSEIGLSAIATETHYQRDKEGRPTRDVAGYTLERSVGVGSANVARVAKAAGEVTQLLRENVRVQSSPPQYTYTKVADLKVQILGEASKDARTRAEEIASNAGCRVGEVRNAQMGVIQITRPNSTEVSGYGLYDTSTIDKDISVVVTVTFGVVSDQ
jgi:hypothetical protein